MAVAKNRIDTLITNQVRGNDQLLSLNKNLKTIADEMAKTGAASKRTNSEVRKGVTGFKALDDQLRRVNRRIRTATSAFITFESSRAISAVIRSVAQSASEFQRLESQLNNFNGGNINETARTIANLRLVAADIPSSLNEITNAFVKLENLGLDNSNDTLRSFADLGAGLGRSLPELIEAVADASTLEFERLKESFGIIARQTNDSIRLTFRGTTTEIGKSAAEIQDAILGLGDLFEGSAQAAQLNVLGNAFTGFFNALTEGLTKVGQESGAFNSIINKLLSFQTDTRFLFDIEGVSDYERAIAEAEAELTALDDAIENFRPELRIPLARLRGDRVELRQELDTLRGELGLLQEQTEAATEGSINQLQRFQQQSELLAQGFQKTIDDLQKITSEQRVQNLFDEFIGKDATLRTNPEFLAQFDLVIEKAREADLALNANNIATQATKDIEALDNLQASVLGATGAASRVYDQAIETLRRVGDGVRDAGIRDSLITELEESFLSDIGPSIIADGTAATERAIEERITRINRAIREAGSRIDTEALISSQDQAALADALEDDLERVRSQSLSVYEKFYNDQLLLKDRFRLANSELGRAISADEQEVLNSTERLFTRSIDINLEGVRTYEEATSRIFAATALLGSSQLDAALDNMEAFIESLGVDLAPQIDVDQALNQYIRDLEQLQASGNDVGNRLQEATLARETRINDLRAQSSRQLVDTIIDGELSVFRARQLGLASWAGIATQTAADVLGIFADNSESIFNIVKALNIATIAIDAYKAISAVIASSIGSGPLGILLGGIQIAGLVAKYAGLIRSVESQQFGDGNIDSNASSTTGLSAARPSFTDQRQTGGSNLVVNVFGSVLDQGGLQQAIADGARTALNDNTLVINETDIRRV